MGDAKDYSGSEGPLPKRVKVDGDASEGKYISGNSRQVSLDPRFNANAFKHLIFCGFL